MDEYLLNYSCADASSLRNDSITLEYWSTLSFQYRATSLTSAVFTLCFLLVGLPSNLLIMVSILWQRLYKEPTYLLLLNLTLVDFLMCLLVMPLTVVSGFAREFVFGNTDIWRCYACQFGVIFTMFGTISLHTLSFLSLDRFLFIKYPLTYHEIVTTRRIALALTCLWIAILVMSICPLFGFGDLVFQRSIATCTIKFYGETKVSKNVYYIIMLVVEAVFPFTLIFFTNVWIVCIVMKQIQRIYSMKNLSKDEKEFMKELKGKLRKVKHHKQLQLIKVFGAFLIAVILTWIPVNIRVFLTLMNGSEHINNWWNTVVYICVLSFAVIHPIFQASLIPDLRKYLVMFFKKVLCWHPVSEYVAKDYCYPENATVEDSREDSWTKCYCLDFLNVTVLPLQHELAQSQSV